MKYAKIMERPTPQTEPVSRKQVKNSAGGYTFELDKWGRLDRFLILGSDSPTYYADAKSLTAANARSIVDCAIEDAGRTVAKIVEISKGGRSHSNDTAIFALAVVATAGDTQTRQKAFGVLNDVARTASHLFAFNAAINALDGKWNRSRRRSVASWYDARTYDQLAYQVLKYRNRNGWSHADLIKLAHVRPVTQQRSAIYRYLVNGDMSSTLPAIFHQFESLQSAENEAEAISMIKGGNLTWEFVPDRFLSSANVWKALRPNLPLTALIRNLGRMTSIGLLKPLSDDAVQVIERIGDQEACRKARLHPLNLLLALKTYSDGHGHLGSLKWDPNVSISVALEEAFYDSFKSFAPTGKRILWAQDVSGSMTHQISGKNVSCAEAGAAMALTMLNVEKSVHVVGFQDRLVDLGISKTDNLRTAAHKAHKQNFGATDCAAPMLYALDNNMKVDLFVVCTDNETYAGGIHPHKALKRYREDTGIDAKLVVIGMTSTGFTIADPDDSGMLDIVGFDPNLYSLISEFSKGW